MQDFVAVDWGTSSFRLWWLAGDGQIRGESRGTEGMQQCQTTGFAPVLQMHLARAKVPDALPILICGMAGARQGWREAPYAALPSAVTSLAQGALRLPPDLMAGRDIRILPGLAQRDPLNPDVMRGEETQLLGLAAMGHQGLICMPGTHCKWAQLRGGAVTAFHSYMTGELFAVLAAHSILRHALPETGPDASAKGAKVDPAHPEFLAALEQTRADPSLLSGALFGIRAAGLLGYRDAKASLARLSGLLIGSEVADQLSQLKDQPVVLLGQAGLGALYEAALQRAGIDLQLADAETATREGLRIAALEIWGDAL